MNGLRFQAAGILGQGLVGSLFVTTRSVRVHPERYRSFRRRGRPVIFVCWHGQLLPLIHYHRNEGVVVLVSEHTDGEYLARVMERHGFHAVRGSSTRGGTRGLKGLIRAARAGRDLALTPDGPQGPSGVFKPGALLVAQVTGHPVLPVVAGASAAWHFDSWDRFMVPRPLSRVAIEYGVPRWLTRDGGQDERERVARELETEMAAMTERVSRSAPDEGHGAPTAPGSAP